MDRTCNLGRVTYNDQLALPLHVSALLADRADDVLLADGNRLTILADVEISLDLRTSHFSQPSNSSHSIEGPLGQGRDVQVGRPFRPGTQSFPDRPQTPLPPSTA